jgi:hypothetical protein
MFDPCQQIVPELKVQNKYKTIFTNIFHYSDLIFISVLPKNNILNINIGWKQSI